MAQQFLAPGTLLQGGNYRIVRYLSSGGFGNTYEAFDVNLNKRVAIKEFFVKDFCERDSQTMLVTPTTSKQPLINHLKKKFVEEARAIADMEHENIIRVKTLFEENNTAYYVMDYIDGESLSDMINRRGPLPEDEAIRIILNVCDALAYMHKQGRFHLDVKPGNIMIRKDGKVILIDFGSSRQYAEVDGENTATISPCYTPGYAPVEQMNAKPTSFTAATDVYAVGATLYKMLTGITPPSAIDLINEEDTLIFPDTISRSAIEAIEKTMIPQRLKRLQSIDEFTRIFVQKEPPTIVPPIPVEEGTEEPPKTVEDEPWSVKEGMVPVSTWDFWAIDQDTYRWFFFWSVIRGAVFGGIVLVLLGGNSMLFEQLGFMSEYKEYYHRNIITSDGFAVAAILAIVAAIITIIGMRGSYMPNWAVKNRKQLAPTDFIETYKSRSDNFAIVARGDSKNRKYGVFDLKRLRLVVPFKYDRLKWQVKPKTLTADCGDYSFLIGTKDDKIR